MFGRLYGVLLPFFASFLLAWLLDPLVTFVQQKCKVKFRTLSVAITLVVFVGLLVLGFYLLVPAIGREVKSAAVAVERYFENFDPDRYFSAETQQKIQEAMNGLNLESLLSYPEVRDGIQNFLPQLGTWITGGLSWLSELLVIFIGLLYLIFLLIAFPSIRANWRNYVPKKHLRQVSTIVHELNVNMNAYFRGQALVALCVGILFAIGFAIIGMPMGFVMGLIVGVLNLVPYMQALGIPPCIILCLVQSAQTGQPVWLTLLLMTIVFIVVQTFQDMFLTPKIMGKVTGLGPAAILLSLSIWGALMGVIGMIIAGLLIGEHGFNILARDSSFELFGKVGLYYIMFLAGLEMNMNDFKENKYKALTLGLLCFTIPIITGTAAPDNVFGRAANNHALAESVTIFCSSAIIFLKFLAKVTTFL